MKFFYTNDVEFIIINTGDFISLPELFSDEKLRDGFIFLFEGKDKINCIKSLKNICRGLSLLHSKVFVEWCKIESVEEREKCIQITKNVKSIVIDEETSLPLSILDKLKLLDLFLRSFEEFTDLFYDDTISLVKHFLDVDEQLAAKILESLSSEGIFYKEITLEERNV